MTAQAANPEYYQFEDVNNAVVDLFRDALRRDKAAGTVLDVGCGRARLGHEIEKLGYTVIGIENSPVACEMARTRISEVVPLNLMDIDGIAATLQGRQFDWLLMADVLEHLPDSLGALCRYRKFLKPNGCVIISLPNVAVWDNRLRLLFGRFNYTDSGVLDRTHLRFFTFRSARQLVIDAGLTPSRTTLEPGIVRAFMPLLKGLVGGKSGGDPGALLDSPAYHLYARYFLPVEHFMARLVPGLLAFRVVILARN